MRQHLVLHVLPVILLLPIVGHGPATDSTAAQPDDASSHDICTVALWLFDEQIGLYPSSLLTDAGPHDYSLVFGRGGQVVPGRFGNALQPAAPARLEITNNWLEEQQTLFGLRPLPRKPGRNIDPMTWENAVFSALWTCGEIHLRRMDFANPIETNLNLGDFDWTVEFWYQAVEPSDDPGVVFEIGSGPRGENDVVTRLTLDPQARCFRLMNQPGGVDAEISTSAALLTDGEWHHVAISYAAADNQLRHWIDGRLQPAPAPAALAKLPPGDEAYVSIGRNGKWKQPLAGRLDELRFSRGQRYRIDFAPPTSFSITYGKERKPLMLLAGPPLLFAAKTSSNEAIELGSRKHLFIDDALVGESNGVTWAVNPPQLEQLVLTEFGGHVSVIQDPAGVIRLYSSGPMDSLVVHTSTNGVDFAVPNLGGEPIHGRPNVVIRDAVGTGEVFIDPNAPPAERWKYVSGMRNRGIFVYTSPDGYHFRRHETSALPFAAGSQSHVFYDDQRQVYVGYHRSDYGASSATGQESERRFVLTEVDDLLKSWPFQPVTRERTAETARNMRIKSHLLDPWYLDNGPLAPGGIGIEFPVVFRPDQELDPPHTDIYVPKALKYVYAPDAYFAFPHVYFHYWEVEESGRKLLGSKERNRGSGTIEVQTMTSRDGLRWKRYPRPAYVSPGRHGEHGTFHMVGMVQGMVRRGDEIWQYFVGAPDFHSAWSQGAGGNQKGVFRAVQRLDGFVSADFDYRGGLLVTKALRFSGNQLRLNINTHATGFAQVAILDKSGAPVPGFTVDECVYLNGDFIDEPVEWLKSGTDLSQLAGKEIRLLIRGRGAKLYALQFVSDDAENLSVTLSK